jgi:GlpG protein
LEPIREGQVWRLITPIFFHGSPLHLLFNMMMTLRIGRLIEARGGSRQMVVLVLVTAVLSNCAQYLFPDTFILPPYRRGGGPFLGMSGVVYGLFGYVWLRGSMDPTFGVRLPPDSIAIMIGWLVLCATDLIGPIANTAHVAGLVAGVAFAYAELQLHHRRP